MTLPRRLAALAELSEVAFAAEQSKLATLTKREAALRSQLTRLVTDRNATEIAQGSAAHQAGADVRWHRWIDTRRQSLNQELAQVMAQKASQVAVVRRAFGKKEALEKLTAKARADAAQIAARRADQMS